MGRAEGRPRTRELPPRRRRPIRQVARETESAPGARALADGRRPGPRTRDPGPFRRASPRATLVAPIGVPRWAPGRFLWRGSAGVIGTMATLQEGQKQGQRRSLLFFATFHNGTQIEHLDRCRDRICPISGRAPSRRLVRRRPTAGGEAVGTAPADLSGLPDPTAAHEPGARRCKEGSHGVSERAIFRQSVRSACMHSARSPGPPVGVAGGPLWEYGPRPWRTRPCAT